MAIETIGGDDAASIAASQLALRFTDDADIPGRFKNRNQTAGKKTGSKIEQRFKQNVDEWRFLVDEMLRRLEPGLAWRIINGNPGEVLPGSRVTETPDFIAAQDYLSQRRDQEGATSAEVGGLAMLVTAFQKEIERRIGDAAE
jgi:PAS domain-containing protein